MNNNCERADTAESAVDLDAFPEPAVRYAVRDETVVLLAANERFVDSFAATEPETPLRTWWTENDISARDRTVADVCSSLIAGDAVDVTVTVGGPDGAAYRLRSAHESGPVADGTIGLSAGPDTSGDTLSGEQIASVVSHDLRNPLDVAKARALGARETGDAEHFDRLEGAHDRMERIIKDVLTLARNDEVIDPSGTVTLDSVATDAWATVDTGQATLAVAEELPAIEADSDRLRRLFENLFRNSVEHGSTGSQQGTGDSVDHSSTDTQSESSDTVGPNGTNDHARTAGSGSGEKTGVTVRVGSTEDGFFVADDGPGIPEQERNRVFEPGYSVADGGTGLGLTIVERIATAHNWTVRLVESDDGGVRFEFGDIVSDS